MKHPIITAALAALLLQALSGAAQAQSGSLRQCQTLAKNIEQYSDLRRGGGKASQMDKWKRPLRESEKKFRKLDCRDHGDLVQRK